MALNIGRIVPNVFVCRSLARSLASAAAPKAVKIKKEQIAKKQKIEPKEAQQPVNVVVRWPPNNKNAAFLCWHPEPEHPYEHTLPLQRDEKALATGESVLRQEYIAQANADHVRRVTRSHGPNWKTLGKVFNDDWHQFRPTPRQSTTKDLLPVPPPEREGELPR